MAIAALVLAAGRGERLGAGRPKAFVALAGTSLLVRSLAALAAVPELDRLVPVVPREAIASLAGLAGLASLPRLAEPVAGGRERQDSVRAGLAALPPEAEWVAVHDAARPFVQPGDVSRVIAAARAPDAAGAALLAVPVRDTIKRVRSGCVVETPPRAECWAAQTPQVFRVELLREALAKAAADGVLGTDDAELVERLGVPVAVVEGDPANTKITTAADLAAAEARLARGGEGA